MPCHNTSVFSKRAYKKEKIKCYLLMLKFSKFMLYFCNNSDLALNVYFFLRVLKCFESQYVLVTYQIREMIL